MSSALTTGRRIGRWGTAARLLVGSAMTGAAVFFGPDVWDVLLGFVAFPLAVSAFVVLRGHAAEPVHLMGWAGHCLNCSIGAVAFLFLPDAALLFYGTSMLVAAVRGYAGCELFAISNWLFRRNDQIACTCFYPVDRAEARTRAASLTQP